jgi:hypothetical protein
MSGVVFGDFGGLAAEAAAAMRGMKAAAPVRTRPDKRQMRQTGCDDGEAGASGPGGLAPWQQGYGAAGWEEEGGVGQCRAQRRGSQIAVTAMLTGAHL